MNQKGCLKDLHKTINTLINNDEIRLPSHTCPQELSNRFIQFFDEKIINIRTALDNSHAQQQREESASRNSLDNRQSQTTLATFDNFSAATEKEIETLIRQSPNKTCILDHVPTWVVKKCFYVFVPIITLIVNMSLSTCSMPSNLKEAVITPLLKKPSLDPDCLKNYRHVSNLSFLSKIKKNHI